MHCGAAARLVARGALQGSFPEARARTSRGRPTENQRREACRAPHCSFARARGRILQAGPGALPARTSAVRCASCNRTVHRVQSPSATNQAAHTAESAADRSDASRPLQASGLQVAHREMTRSAPRVPPWRACGSGTRRGVARPMAAACTWSYRSCPCTNGARASPSRTRLPAHCNVTIQALPVLQGRVHPRGGEPRRRRRCDRPGDARRRLHFGVVRRRRCLLARDGWHACCTDLWRHAGSTRMMSDGRCARSAPQPSTTARDDADR